MLPIINSNPSNSCLGQNKAGGRTRVARKASLGAAGRFAQRLIILAITLTALAASPSAFAQGSSAQEAAFAKLVKKLAGDSYSARARAVKAIAATGHPRAATVLKALKARRIYLRLKDNGLVIAASDEAPYSLTDAITGKPAGKAGDDQVEQIGVNNKVRHAIRTALSGMTALSKDPKMRIKAAQSFFKSRDASKLPIINKAIGADKDATARQAFIDARAAILLTATKSSEQQRLAAIATLLKRGDQDAIGVLNQAAGGNSKIAAAAKEAIAKIEDKLKALAAVQNVVYGLSLGSVLLLAAIGLAITFGVMGVINMAHGEMVMIGAYVTFTVQEMIRAYAPGLFDASLFIALPLAFAVTGILGIIIERSMIRFLYGRPLETLLATFGLSLILQQAIRSLYGPTNRDVGTPSWMSGSIELAGLTLTLNRLVIILFALTVFAALLVLLKRTAFGLRMRAVVQNREMANSMGIGSSQIDSLTFGLGSGIAGIAGVALSQIDNVSPNLGQGYIIDSFMVVVFGGVGNLWGTLVGAMTLGVANKVLEPYAGAVLGKILVLVLLILFIQKHPRGLFALKGRSVES